MFTNIHYDYSKHKIYHWYVDENGKHCKEMVGGDDLKVQYYTLDETNQSPIKDIYGNSVVMQESKSLRDMKMVKDAGVQTYEADVGMDIKFLHNRYRNETLNSDISNFNVAVIDIETSSEGAFVGPDESTLPINLISVWVSKTNEVYTFGLYEYTGTSDTVKNYHYCADETVMLERFIKFWRRAKIDIATGWNCFAFDFPYIINRCKLLGIEHTLSPVDIITEKNINGYHFSGKGYKIAGLSILDYLGLYTNFTYDKKDNYKLNSICIDEIGEGKIEYEGEIHTIWKTDWNTFVEYNVQDVMLVKKLDDKKKFIQLTIDYCYQTLVPFENVYSSVALITGYCKRYLNQNNMVLSNRPPKVNDGRTLPGAYVLAVPGLHKHCLSRDIESEYPHMIMRYNISPETLIKGEEAAIRFGKDRLYSTPIPGIYYRKDIKGVLNSIVETVFNERKHLKNKKKVASGMEKHLTNDEIASNNHMPLEQVVALRLEIEEEGFTSAYYGTHEQIRKIFINSVYGVLGNEFFSFYNLDNAMAITLGGQDLIKFLSFTTDKYLKEYMHKIAFKVFPEYNKGTPYAPLRNDTLIVLDTDSNYLCLDEIINNFGIEFKNDEEFRLFAHKFNSQILDPFYDKIMKIYFNKFGIEKTVNFKLEKIIAQMFVLTKKQYAAELIEKEGDIYVPRKFDVTGIAMVRTDTPKFFREEIKTILVEIFKSNDRNVIIDMMREIRTRYNVANVELVATPSGVSDYDKWSDPMDYYLEHGIRYKLHLPIHNRAAINFNYLVTKDHLPYEVVTNKAKIKYFYCNPRNELKQNIIGFMGRFPKEFEGRFEIDRDKQWDTAFKNIIQSFFEVLGWGDIDLRVSTMDEMFSM